VSSAVAEPGSPCRSALGDFVHAIPMAPSLLFLENFCSACRTQLQPLNAFSLLHAPTCSPAVPDPLQVCDVHHIFKLQDETVVFARD